jgi:hypothetical protein
MINFSDIGLEQEFTKLLQPKFEEHVVYSDPYARAFLQEAPTKKLRVFDFDDTLVHVKAMIGIIHKDGSKEKLTPAEYAVYDPQSGDKFDFKEFSSIIKNANPISRNINKLKDALEDPNTKTTILTARLLGYPIKKYLKDNFGIAPYVVGLGSSNPQDKADWIEKQIQKGYNDIEFMDDSPKNIQAVNQLKMKYPNVRLYTELVK